MQAENKEEIGEVVTGVLLSVASYPLTCAKTLVQLGHEPLNPVLTRTLFGKTRLCYPNMFAYARHIMAEEGFGIFSGLPAKVLGTSLQTYTTTEAKKVLDEKLCVKRDGSNRSKEDFLKYFASESAALSVGVVLSQPLRVLMVRQIAYLIGKEDGYRSMLSSISEIYSSEGVSGFFSGLIPRLLAELACLWLTHLFTAICTGQITVGPNDPNHANYQKASSFASSLFAGQLTYSMQLVATNMTVSGAKMSASPTHDGWIDCYRQLSQMGSLKRGSSVFFRYKSIPRETLV